MLKLPPPIAKGLIFKAIAVCACAAFTACHDKSPAVPDDPVEDYTRDFIKNFGTFQATSWSESLATGVTVRTTGVNSLRILAEIDGQRYMFADLGHIEGVQAIPINIPKYLKTLIIEVDGEREVMCVPGGSVDLDSPSSRAIATTQYVDKISWGNTTVNVNPAQDEGDDLYRRVMFTPTQLKNMLWDKPQKKFKIGEKSNFSKFNGSTFDGSKFTMKALDKYAVTIYPVYWQANRYGETDYLVGVYFFAGDASKIEMHDLFEVKDYLKRCDAQGGNIEQLPAAGASFTKADDFCTSSRGYSVSFEKATSSVYWGIYVKSGLKDGTRENFGRDCEHISFQDLRYNSYEWGNDNAWNLTLNDIDFCYTGAQAAEGWCLYSANNTYFTQLDGSIYGSITNSDPDNAFKKLAHRNLVAFTAAPSGIDSNLPDFSDCVLMVDTNGNGPRRELKSLGEGVGLFPWYLAAEDLGGSEDWDFNDLVVNIYDVTTDMTKSFSSSNAYYPVPSIFGRRIIVDPVATGATLPVYLMYEGDVAGDVAFASTLQDAKNSVVNFQNGTYVIGTEIHKWLGGGDDYTTFINVESDYTDASPRGRAVSFCVPVLKDANGNAVSFDSNHIPQDVGINNQTMRGFWVLVDKDNKMAAQLQNPNFEVTPLAPTMSERTNGIARYNSEVDQATNIFSGRLGQGSYKVDCPIKDPNCVAPQMLMCHKGWFWCRERESIDEVYSSFADWVAGKRDQWHQTNETGSIDQGTNGYNPTKVCKRDKQPTFIQ